MTSSRCPLCLVACIVTVAAFAPAHASPLDGETCARVKSEHKHLETAGVDRDMAKGPVWAKANLAPEKLELVRRFIELEAVLLFRCREKSLVTLRPDPEVAAVGEQRKDKQSKDRRDERKPAAAKSAAPPKKVTAPATKAPPKGGAGRQSQWGVIVVERSPPPPAVDDADKPPAFDPAAIAEKLGLPPG